MLSNFTFKDERQEKAVKISQNEVEPDDSGFVMPETLENPFFVPGFLATQIGKYMRVEFLIGNVTTDRVGRLVKVGASYIILHAVDGNNVMCDMFSIKFAEIVDNPTIVI